jgi:hypothetical protein
MNEPCGELVELDFYFCNMKRADAFSRVVMHCCQHGGIFAGEALIVADIDARNNKFVHIYDRPVNTVTIDAVKLAQTLGDLNSDIVKVGIRSAIGIRDPLPEIITYAGVSPDASHLDNPSIAIVSEGWVFSTPGFERRAFKAGKRCYNKFIEICNALDPAYAAILNEDSLPCRYDLFHGRGKNCFLNFFVSNQLRHSDTIEKMYQDAYTERTPTGIYVSTWGMFNPRKKSIDTELGLERSSTIAKLLGSNNP